MRRFATMVAVALLVGSGVALLDAQGKKTPTDPALLSIPRTGSVLHTPGITAIFWGAEWADAGFSDDIIVGMDQLLGGYSGSDYARASTEYYDRNGSISGYSAYRGHVLDLSAAPAPGSLTTSVAIAAACRATNNQPNPEDVHIVMTSTDHGGTGACVFHVQGTCGKRGAPILVMGVPFASGVAGTGCDALQDNDTGHSLALAQMANIVIHELADTITNPRGDGWRDGSGASTSDKCIRIFPNSLIDYPVFSNGSVWKLQGQWSNAAYVANSGTPNQSGQAGCVWRR